MKALLYLLCSLLLANCSGNSYQKAIIENRIQIINELSNTAYSRYQRGGGEAILFDTFKGQQENHYSFFVANEKLILKKQTVQFQEIPERENIPAYILNLEKELKSFGIKTYDGQPNGLGVLLLLHMKDGGTILYTEDISHIKHPLTLAYIRKAKPLYSNWYYRQDEY